MYSISDLLGTKPVRLISHARIMLHICTDIYTCSAGISELFWGIRSKYTVQSAVICFFATEASSSVLPLFPSFPRQCSSKKSYSSPRYLNYKILRKRTFDRLVMSYSVAIAYCYSTYLPCTSVLVVQGAIPGVMIYDALVVRCRSLVCKAFIILERRGG